MCRVTPEAGSRRRPKRGARASITTRSFHGWAAAAGAAAGSRPPPALSFPAGFKIFLALEQENTTLRAQVAWSQRKLFGPGSDLLRSAGSRVRPTYQTRSTRKWTLPLPIRGGDDLRVVFPVSARFHVYRVCASGPQEGMALGPN